MKILLLTGMLLATAQNSQAKTLVISDIDDTIKVADVLGKESHVVFNGLFRSKAFSGMSELYQEMSRANSTIYYVTGSPRMIKGRVQNFLEDNQFPQRENLILKEKRSDDTYNYKTKTIRELINKVHPDKMILIGDDTQFDSEVYKTISDENPGVVEAVYIRAIQNKAVPYQTFFSAVEIAASELVEGRLSNISLSKVGEGFLKQTHRSGISIEDRYCPVHGTNFIEELKQKIADEAIITLLEKTQNKIISSCK